MAYYDQDQDNPLDREALINQLGQQTAGPNVPGIQAPVDPAQTPVEPPMSVPGAPPAAPPTASPQSYQDILSKYTYGAKGLGEAEGELNAAGYKLQKHSDGRVRGRIFDPSGRGIDVTDTNEGNDWWNGQTGSKWGDHDAGFGSPEVTTPEAAQGSNPNLLPTGEAAGIQAGGGDGVFERLMAQLQAQSGAGQDPRETLMALLGA